MKKIFFIIFMILLLQTKVVAYETGIIEHDTDIWILDDQTPGDNKVTLYLAVDPASTGIGNYVFYDFDAVNAIFDGEESAYSMQYQFRYDKDDIIYETDTMVVLLKAFSVENGTYCFGDMGQTHPLIPGSFDNITNCDFNELNKKLTVSLSGSDPVHIYALAGDYKWACENMTDFISFAGGKEESSYSFMENKQEEQVQEPEVSIEEISDVSVTIEETKTDTDPSKEDVQTDKKNYYAYAMIAFTGIGLIAFVAMIIYRLKS